MHVSGWDGLPQVCGDGHAQEGDCVVPLSCALLPVRDRVSAAAFDPSECLFVKVYQLRLRSLRL